MSRYKQNASASTASQLFRKLQQVNVMAQFKKSASAHSGISRSIGAMEGLDDDDLELVTAATGDAETSLSDTLVEAVGDDVPTPVVTEEESVDMSQPEAVRLGLVTAAGLESAALIAASLGDLSGYRAPESLSWDREVPRFAGTSGPHGDVSFAVPALEAFDTNDIESHVSHSMTYNMFANRQNDFGEMWYRTMVGSPDTAMYNAVLERVMAYQGALHNMNGDIAVFNKRNIIESLRDHTVLENQVTNLIPYKVTTGTNANVDKFLAGVNAPDAVLDGVTYPTGPLKASTKIGFMGVSMHPTLLHNQVYNQTDAIDSFVRLKAAYFTVSNGTDSAIVKFDTLRIPTNQFLFSGQRNGKQTTLTFRTRSLTINKDTVDANGDPIAFLSAVATNDLRVRIDAKVNGDLNLETGQLIVSDGVTDVFRVVDAAGEVVNDPSLANITLTLAGFDLDARVTNSNRRQRGLLLDCDVWREVYEVGLQAPMSIQKPTAPYVNSGKDVDALITATHIRISNLAVTTLLNYAEMLKAYVASRDADDFRTSDSYDGADIEGIARMVMTPFYDEFEIDMLKVINNVRSQDLLKDIQGYFVAVITELAYRMLQSTNYRAALEVIRGASTKPVLYIGTDQVLSQFIMVQGDDRTLGTDLSYRKEATPDLRFYNQIVIGLGCEGSGFNYMNFGTLVYVPELVSSIPVNRTGTTIEETMVQARFRHINNVPAMAKITVINLKEAIQSRIRLSVETHAGAPVA